MSSKVHFKFSHVFQGLWSERKTDRFRRGTTDLGFESHTIAGAGQPRFGGDCVREGSGWRQDG
jgi:hypothetical protein